MFNRQTAEHEPRNRGLEPFTANHPLSSAMNTSLPQFRSASARRGPAGAPFPAPATAGLRHDGAFGAALPGIGFTLIELLVTISVIGVLSALLLPALSSAKQKVQGVYCLNNGKQMIVALTLYVDSNNDLFPPNPDDGTTLPGHNWCSGVAGNTGPAEFNPDLLLDPTRSLLAPYLQGNPSLFHCPGDKRVGLYQGTDPKRKGTKVPSARSFSMNQAVGTICPGFDVGTQKVLDKFPGHSGVPRLPVNGPWLNNDFNHRRDLPWATYGRFSAITAPGPAMLWILVDENQHGLNDAAFAFGMEKAVWIDAPGSYHNGGCGFAFADGHSESHRWSSLNGKQAGLPHIADDADRRDWQWMKERTSAFKAQP